MNLLTLSDDEARSLGLNVTRLRFGLIVCATLITASTVAIAGIIGWVGLVVPHIARLLTGHNHQQLLPMAVMYWRDSAPAYRYAGTQHWNNRNPTSAF